MTRTATAPLQKRLVHEVVAAAAAGVLLVAERHHRRAPLHVVVVFVLSLPRSMSVTAIFFSPDQNLEHLDVAVILVAVGGGVGAAVAVPKDESLVRGVLSSVEKVTIVFGVSVVFFLPLAPDSIGTFLD